jgi:tetratricopeptide (TPR) repeat protein
MRSVILTLFLLASLLAGCASQPPNKPDTYSTPTADLNSFEGFSEALEQSMAAKDTSLFVERLDTHQFARRSLTSLGLPVVKDETVNAYAGIMGKALKRRFTQTFAEVESASFVRLLPGESTRLDEAVSLIRIQPEDGGINYWKVHLRRSNGQISIVDWFSYSLGELASRSLGSFILQAGVAALKPDSEGAEAIKAYLAAAQSNDLQKQLDAYESLPDRLKKNSLLMFAHVQTAMKISDDAYGKVLAELAPLYQMNDNYALMLVDYYLINDEYEKAHQAIDKVTAKIGQEAGLDNLHASIALQNGDYKRTIGYARDGINREPSYEDNYWVLLDALVFSENYTDAVLVLNILEEGFNYRFDARQMATLEGYEDFSRSEAFNGWQTASAH